LGALRGGETIKNQPFNAEQELEWRRNKLRQKKQLEEKLSIFNQQNQNQNENQNENENFPNFNSNISYKNTNNKNRIKYQSAFSYLKSSQQSNRNDVIEIDITPNLEKSNFESSKKQQNNSMKIHDYRGPKMKIVDIKSISSQNMSDTARQGIVMTDVCPQFRHNINLCVELCQNEIEKTGRNLESLKNTQFTLNLQLEHLTNKKYSQESNLTKLQNLSKIISNIQNISNISNISNSQNSNISKNSDIIDISNSNISNSSKNVNFENDSNSNIEIMAEYFKNLQTKFHSEYIRFQICKMIPNVVYPLIQKELGQNWDFLLNSEKGLNILRLWKPLLMSNDTLYEHLFDNIFLPHIHKYLRDCWNVTNLEQSNQLQNFISETCVFEKTKTKTKNNNNLMKLIPKKSYNRILINMIIPKLREIIENGGMGMVMNDANCVQWFSLWLNPNIIPRDLNSFQNLLQIIRKQIKNFFKKKWFFFNPKNSNNSFSSNNNEILLLETQWKLLLAWKRVGLFYENEKDWNGILIKYILNKIHDFLVNLPNNVNHFIKSSSNLIENNSNNPINDIKFFEFIKINCIDLKYLNILFKFWKEYKLFNLLKDGNNFQNIQNIENDILLTILQRGFFQSFLKLIHENLALKKNEPILELKIIFRNYLFWKYEFFEEKTQNLKENNDIFSKYFETCLNMINYRCDNVELEMPMLDIMLSSMTIHVPKMMFLMNSVSGSVTPAQFGGYFENKRRQKSVEMKQNDVIEVDEEEEIDEDAVIPGTFKEMIQHFAMKNSIIFAPRVGQVVDGKQVYSFGQIPIYLWENVIYAKNKNKQWECVGMQQLLEISRL